MLTKLFIAVFSIGLLLIEILIAYSLGGALSQSTGAWYYIFLILALVTGIYLGPILTAIFIYEYFIRRRPVGSALPIPIGGIALIVAALAIPWSDEATRRDTAWLFGLTDMSMLILAFTPFTIMSTDTRPKEE